MSNPDMGSNRPPLVIWGAGGQGRVVLDVARSLGYADISVIDDAYEGPAPSDFRHIVEFIVAIGDNYARARCFRRGLELGWRPATLVHPRAVVSTGSTIHPGTVVLPAAVINAGAVIGRNCIVNTGAIVEHDCCVGDHAHISPAATLAGNVSVESFAHVGVGASVIPGKQVGEGSVVGAGAVVTKDVAGNTTAVGVPARALTKRVTQPENERRILLSVPHMSGFEQKYVGEAFESNWISTVGPNVEHFEREFARTLDPGGNLSAVAVSSGTSAIHLGLRALKVQPGDTVFCSDLTFVATVNPICYLGAEPVLIDSNRNTWNMDPEALSEALRNAAARNHLPRAVIVVHLYGQCADMKPILSLCASYDVPVLEDAAEALGATYSEQAAGTMGDLAAFSFNGNKMITTSGGGMLVSRNSGRLTQVRFWATQARDPGIAYNHSEIGYNYRLSNVLAGIGRGQLRVLNQRVQQRREIAFRYRDAFADLPGIELMPQAAYGVHANWLSCFLIDDPKFGCSRDGLVHALDGADIETRPVWKPMHLQALYAHSQCYGGAVAEDLYRRGICLPSSSSLSADEQLYVVNQVRRAAGAPMLEDLAELATLV